LTAAHWRAERLEPRPVTARGREFGGDQNPAAEQLAQLLDSSHFVHRGTDDGNFEAIDGADIAVKHLAEVKRKITTATGFPSAPDRR
jgi:hypothetical protein